MSNDYRVKSSSIRSKFDFERDRFGEAAERGFLPVLDSVMYPFEDYDAANRAIAEEFFAGFYAGAADLLGVDNLDRDLSLDAAGARFHLRWQ